jgi:5-methylcytosine-specific restriction protein B
LKQQHNKIVQFHPSYTYEDFVRGVKLEVDEATKTPKYEVVNKIFAELCEEAANNPDMNYVLIIDEINRANLPVVLGELIYVLEYRDEEVETPYKVGDKGTLKVPSNLYIIGTMNTADRSIGHIDYAIRRRFVFKEILPDKSVINPGAKKLYEEVIEKLFQPENVSAEFKSSINDVKIGHTYFLVKDDEKEKLKTSKDEDIETKILSYKFLYQVVPLIKEYIKDGILIEEKVEAVFQEVFKKYLNNLCLEDVINYINTSNNKGGTS